MLISLDTSDFGEEHNGHLWGHERWLVNEPEYCAKLLVLENDESSSKHYHKEKKETFIVLHGTVSLDIYDEIVRFNILGEGSRVDILPGQIHSFYALMERALILEVSTHHDDSDTYRIREGDDD